MKRQGKYASYLPFFYAPLFLLNSDVKMNGLKVQLSSLLKHYSLVF